MLERPRKCEAIFLEYWEISNYAVTNLFNCNLQLEKKSNQIREKIRIFAIECRILHLYYVTLNIFRVMLRFPFSRYWVRRDDGCREKRLLCVLVNRKWVPILAKGLNRKWTTEESSWLSVCTSKTFAKTLELLKRSWDRCAIAIRLQ